MTNLVKYWPLLAAGRPAKRFVLVHIFRVSSAGDYAAHRGLWEFLVERMRMDVEDADVRWPQDWEARIFTYRQPDDVADAQDFVRQVLTKTDP